MFKSKKLWAILAILALGILCTGVNFLLFAEGIKRLSASLAGIITSLSLIFNLLLAHWFLGEAIGVKTLAAGGLIIAGIIIIVLNERG